MTVAYQYGVQDVVNQVIEVTYDELTSGSAYNLMRLPDGAMLLGGTYWVLTAFNSGTSDAAVLAFNGLTLVTDADAQAKARTVFTMPTTVEADVDKVSVSTPTYVTYTWTGAGSAATAGKIRVEVQYIVKGRAFAVQK